MNKFETAGSVIGVLIITAVILAWPTQWLWNNALVGVIDGINPIGFWQALGLNFLFGILIKPNSNSK